MKRLFFLLCATVLAVASTLPASADDVVYKQGLDPAFLGYLSESTPLDPTGFQYDNFTLAAGATLTSIDWNGLHKANTNPVSGFVTPIDGFDIGIFDDATDNPNALLYSEHINGTANEAFDDVTFQFVPNVYYVESYSAQINFTAMANTQYWLSIVADASRSQTWAWATGDGGDGFSLSMYPGYLDARFHDEAFTLNTASVITPPPPPPATVTPEPASLMLTGTGILTLAGAARRKIPRREAKS